MSIKERNIGNARVTLKFKEHYTPEEIESARELLRELSYEDLNEFMFSEERVETGKRIDQIEAVLRVKSSG